MSSWIERGPPLSRSKTEFSKKNPRLLNSIPGNSKSIFNYLIFVFKATRAILTAEESKVERLKSQLKELFRFSQDMQPLSDRVICAIREYQRYFLVKSEKSLKTNYSRGLGSASNVETMHILDWFRFIYQLRKQEVNTMDANVKFDDF